MAGAVRARHAAGDTKVTPHLAAQRGRWLPKDHAGNNRERLRKVAAGWEALCPSLNAGKDLSSL